MKNILFLLLTFIFSCSSKQEKKEYKAVKSEKIETPQKVKAKTPASSKNETEAKDSKETEKSEHSCEDYFKYRFPKDSVKARIINEIIDSNVDSLSSTNLQLLQSLKTQEKGLAFKHSLNSIFRIKEDELGIIFYPKFKRTETTLLSLSEETSLIEMEETENDETLFLMNEVQFYPQILDSIYVDQKKPEIYFYTINRMGSARIKDLGKYYGECMFYYEYSLEDSQVNINDSVLFASSLKLDLEFEGNSKLDSLIEASYDEYCIDCPSSEYLFRSFARLKGVDDLYFSYADTFPINDELDTPARALVYMKEDKPVYLWYSEVDLFGCSCL